MRHTITFAIEEEAISQKMVWLTDLHLDAADKARVRKFFDLVVQEKPDVILIGGDISNGVSSLVHLKHLAALIEKPFYFVLGNHDYYYGSIKKIRNLAEQASKTFKTAHYLTTMGVIKLTHRTALIGHDGWADGRAGNFLDSTILLNDYFLIDELKNLPPKERLNVLKRLGDEAAEQLEKRLSKALDEYERVIVLMHTPPFQQSCLYEGKVCSEDWAPHFVCQAAGDMLLEVVAKHPDKNVLVLCGHSHHAADRFYLPNLRVLTGHSTLGDPMIQGVIGIT